MSNIGLYISLFIIVGGLVWLTVRSLIGKEVDRRVIFLFIAISTSVPLLFNIISAHCSGNC